MFWARFSLILLDLLGPGDKDEDRHVVGAEVHAPTAMHDVDVLRNPQHLYWGIYDGHCGHFVSGKVFWFGTKRWEILVLVNSCFRAEFLS